MNTTEISKPDASVPATIVNTTTKEELCARGKKLIEQGDKAHSEAFEFYRGAAEILAIAAEEYEMTQREIAKSVGKSAGWVNGLLRWREDGYLSPTVFGPASKAARERKNLVQAPEQTPETAPKSAANDAKRDEITTAPGSATADESMMVNIVASTMSENANLSAVTVEADDAVATPAVSTTKRTVAKPPGGASSIKEDASARALAEFKSTVDRLCPAMNYDSRCEAVQYLIKKSKVKVA